MSPALRQLVQKELHRQRGMVIAALIFTTLPYLFCFAIVCLENSNWRSDRWAIRFLEAINTGSHVATVMSCLLAGFFAGNAIAGERPTRSIEFLSCIPVQRRSDLWSRLLVSTALTVLFLIINALILGVSAYGLSRLQGYSSEKMLLVIGLELLSAFAAFGVAWLLSVVAKTPVIAAAAGPASVLLLLMIVASWSSSGTLQEREQAAWFAWTILYPTTNFLLGLATILAGCVIHLRRRVPV